jgi:hypothetical protein
MKHNDVTVEHEEFTVVYRLYETSSHPETLDNLTDVEIDELLYQIDEKQARLLNDDNSLSAALGKVAFVGYDAEWIDLGVGGNNPLGVLSYQFYLVGEGGDMAAVFLPKSTDFQDRLALKDMIDVLFNKALNIGILTAYPAQVVFTGFFLRADLAVLSDLIDFKNELSNVGGKVATVGNKTIGMFCSKKNYERLDSNRRFTLGISNQACYSQLRFYDIAKHAPEKTPLSALGDLLGLEKLTIADGYSISQMDIYLAQQRDLFLDYAIRDAEIVVKHYLSLLQFARENVTGDRAIDGGFLPVSAGSMAVKMFLETLTTDYRETFGLKHIKREVFDELNGGFRTITKDVKHEHRNFHEDFATDCFFGGRNESYYFGASHKARWLDLDLSGAYTTGLCSIGLIDYQNSHETKNLDDFTSNTIGFAWVKFKFPATVRFPCLPVRMGSHGLIFPLAGVSYCTAPEIFLAKTMDASLSFERGVIYPSNSDVRIFQPFVSRIRSLRDKYPSKSLPEQYAKLLGNSVYGKLGQGIHSKTGFDTNEMISIKTSPSAISNAPMAAFVTGFVRAVMGEILNSIPVDRTVISCTTDGILTDASESELNLTGELCQRFQQLVELVSPNGKMLEVKHEVKQVLSIRTRGTATLIHGDNPNVANEVLAKSSVSLPEGCTDANQYIVDLFFNREVGRKTKSRPFVSVRQQWLGETDVFRLERDITLNFEYDFKRKPVNPREVNGHLVFDTVPWCDTDVAAKVRLRFDKWRERHCLKVLQDFYGWDEHRETSLALENNRLNTGKSRSSVNITANGSADILIRTLLKAYVRNVWGFEKYGANQKVMQSVFKKLGHVVSANQFKNAYKGELNVNTVPQTEKTKGLLNEFVSVFPALETDKFFIIG